MKYITFAILTFLLITGCKPSTIPMDTSTPEGVILLTEDAYRRGDLEAVIALKNFQAEAFYMLTVQMGNKFEISSMGDDLVQKTAEVLELAFRKEMQESGLPDFSDLESSFPKKKDLGNGYWAVTEICKFPDGGHSEEMLLVFFNGTEYGLCNPINE
jgi:hypothetical protein